MLGDDLDLVGGGVHLHHRNEVAADLGGSDRIRNAYSAPTIQATGDLITAAIWNQNVVNNVAYLHGDTGTVSLAAGLTVGSANLTAGEAFLNSARAHRHPYGAARHIESGRVAFDTQPVTVTFTQAYSSGVVVVAGLGNGIGNKAPTAESISTTGFVLHGDAGVGLFVHWISDGPD